MPEQLSAPRHPANGEHLRIQARQEARRWLIHLAIILVVQAALIPCGYSMLNPIARHRGGSSRHCNIAHHLVEG